MSNYSIVRCETIQTITIVCYNMLYGLGKGFVCLPRIVLVRLSFNFELFLWLSHSSSDFNLNKQPPLFRRPSNKRYGANTFESAVDYEEPTVSGPNTVSVSNFPAKMVNTTTQELTVDNEVTFFVLSA